MGNEVRSWLKSLNSYSYPVKLYLYKEAWRFPCHFKKDIIGDRESTMKFENYFREKARQSIEVYFEVIFWKLFSQKNIRDKKTTEIIKEIIERKTKPEELYGAIKDFTVNPSKSKLQELRSLLNIKTNVLAIPLTFVAFFCPEKYPMVDKNVAKWVNKNLAKHNQNRQAKLTPFVSLEKSTSLTDVDFQSYLNWVDWCNETAQILTDNTSIKWRARDVEMAVFTAIRTRDNLELEILT